MSKTLDILIVEAAAHDAELIQHELRKADLRFKARRAETRQEFVRELEKNPPDLILSDYSLPKFDGMTALRLTKKIAPHVPFILVTGYLSEEIAVECMKSGASDYVIKDHLVRRVINFAMSIPPPRKSVGTQTMNFFG